MSEREKQIDRYIDSIGSDVVNFGAPEYVGDMKWKIHALAQIKIAVCAAINLAIEEIMAENDKIMAETDDMPGDGDGDETGEMAVAI